MPSPTLPPGGKERRQQPPKPTALWWVLGVLTLLTFAGDWVVTRLRGTVEQLVGETWVPLKRGDSIEYDRDVRTLSDGHAELQRNLEVLTLDVNTAIRIQHDTETGFTTVLQDFGRLDVDAEVKRVKHFAVQTAYLAAVVKGTHFIVTTDLDGSTVEVDRGAVAVTSAASERSTTISDERASTWQPIISEVGNGHGCEAK